MDALATVALQRQRPGSALERHLVARLLELNGRLPEAEQVLLAAIDPTLEVQKDPMRGWYGEFLARRGRFQEALPLIEQHDPGNFRCMVAHDGFRYRKFGWVELCWEGLHAGACEESLFEKRLEIVGIYGAAGYVAQRSLESGSSVPQRHARAWFERTLQLSRLPIQQLESWKAQFEIDLRDWEESLRASPTEPEIDWKNPAEVERAVGRAHEIAGTDEFQASCLLQSVAETGLPVAGYAVLELVADPSLGWPELDRSWLMEVWRDAILTRTYGYADPEDPATW